MAEFEPIHRRLSRHTGLLRRISHLLCAGVMLFGLLWLLLLLWLPEQGGRLNPLVAPTLLILTAGLCRCSSALMERRAVISADGCDRLFENSPDLYFELSKAGNILYASPSVETVLKYQPDQLVGSNILKLLPYPRELETLLQELEQHGAASNRRLHLWRSDRRQQVVLLLSLQQRSNRTGHYAILAHDITQHETIEQACVELASNLNAVLQSCDEMIWSVDGRDFTLITYNNAMETYFRVVMGLQVYKGVPLERMALPERVETWKNFYQQALETGEFRIEHQMLKDQKWLEVTFYPIDSGDGHTNISIFAKDIDERRQKIEEIKALNESLERRVIVRTLELQSANQALESYSRTIFHELKTPLRAIQAYLELLNEDHTAGMGEEGREYIRDIGRICGQTLDMIQNLLVHSRAGYKDLQFTLIDMKNLILSVFEDIRVVACKKPIVLQISDLPPVLGDRDLMRQAVYNILSNSVKFSQQNDTVKIEISAHETQERLVITIRDHGIGFDMQYAARLCSLFETLHSSEEYEGTGVGLAIVKTVMERHGGEVRIEGQPDKGCAVSLLFQKNPYTKEAVYHEQYQGGAGGGIALRGGGGIAPNADSD